MLYTITCAVLLNNKRNGVNHVTKNKRSPLYTKCRLLLCTYESVCKAFRKYSDTSENFF